MAILPRVDEDLGETVSMRLQSLALAELTMRCTFDWAGFTDIPCVAGPLEKMEVMSERGGWDTVKTATFEVRTSELPEGIGHPKTNDVVSFKVAANADPEILRIVKVKNWFNASLEITCADTNHSRL